MSYVLEGNLSMFICERSNFGLRRDQRCPASLVIFRKGQAGRLVDARRI